MRMEHCCMLCKSNIPGDPWRIHLVITCVATRCYHRCSLRNLCRVPGEGQKNTDGRQAIVQKSRLQPHTALHSTLTQRAHSVTTETPFFSKSYPLPPTSTMCCHMIHLASVTTCWYSSPLANCHTCFWHVPVSTNYLFFMTLNVSSYTTTKTTTA